MLVSHEVPKSLLDLSLSFNDYDYFLIHQIFKFQEYRDFFKKSKDLNRRQILDNSLYELKETFDPDVFADYIKELKPSEYLIPDCFNDFQKNLDLFDDWMSKYYDLPGLKIATIHGKTMKEFQDAYDIFKSYDIKIAFNFAEDAYKQFPSPIEGRYRFINSVNIDRTKKHHLLGCTNASEFFYYRNFEWIDTIDTSNPIMAAFEGNRYPIFSKPKLAVDDTQDTEVTKKIRDDVLYNVTMFKEIIKNDKSKLHSSIQRR